MDKKYFTYFSPAKVNLFFKILFKRKDGYHEIASLYQTINLGDFLHIRLGNKDSFKCSDSDISNNENLVCKAIDLFKKKTNLSFHADIFLEKNIPLQAGLGGGSSNAATALFAINELLKNPVSLQDLVEWSKYIGSDVAFFLSQGTAFCSGRGEIFKDIKQPQKFSAFIAKPKFGLSTQDVYKNVKIDFLDKNDVSEALKAYSLGKFDFFNDLEKAAFSVNPELKKIKDELYSMGFSKVLMTGSGSAFYCLGENLPKNSDISFYKVEGIWRNSDKWYSLI
jgi:4-diphosphocytidyl-2-C-methyl-D-erythritol kinase